jgi:regulator of sirC expression with transglutaminase-like and TPR domain
MDVRSYVVKVCFTFSLLFSLSVHALTDKEQIEQLQALLATPEDQIDFTQAKLTIDKLIDPSVDIAANTKQVDRIVHAVKVMLSSNPNPTSAQKVLALNDYLYKKGHWNNNQTYEYDLKDPYGTAIENKLLPSYLKSRKGNCVSMPALFIAAGQKLGLDVSLSVAPNHVFVKFRDETTGKIHNFETTNGGGTTDEQFKARKQISDLAVEKGAYLRKLSKRESIALLAATLVQKYQKKRPEKAIYIGAILLDNFQTNTELMVKMSYMHYQIMRDQYEIHYKSILQMPPEVRQEYDKLARRNVFFVNMAKDLGWIKPTQESGKRYKKLINQHQDKKTNH